MNRKLSAICNFKKVKTIDPEATIKVAVDILNEHHIGCLVVMANDEIAGILSERDILKTLGNTSVNDNIHHIVVKDVMTKKEDLIVADPESTLEQLMHIMRDSNIRHIPIVDNDGKLTCITSIRDVVRLLLEDSEEKVDHLNDYITGKYPA
jgi:CBS domain-containing protein